MRVSFDIKPNAVTVGWFGGTVYGVIGDVQETIPLLGIEGIGINRTVPLPAEQGGGYRIFNRENGVL